MTSIGTTTAALCRLPGAGSRNRLLSGRLGAMLAAGPLPRWARSAIAVLVLALVPLAAPAASPGSPVLIGTNTLLSLPSSALFHLFIGNAPDDGSAQTLNPPVFKWLYFEDPWTIGYPNNAVRSFRFQLSTNGSFASPYWNITTSNNFYNCLPPITNANGTTWLGSNYWRIIYLSADSSSSLATSAVHHFTLSPSAKTWNRAMLADNNYLLSIGTNHPHMFFSVTNRDAMSVFLGTNTVMGWSWQVRSNIAFQTITNSWWNDDSFTNQEPQLWIDGIASVALMYQITTNATLVAANPGQMASRLASRMIQLGYDRYDSYRLNNTPKELALIYDWTYNDMTSLQRSNVVWAMEQFAKFYVYEDWWYTTTPPDPTRQYKGPFNVGFYSAAKTGISHERSDYGTGLFLTMAGMGESATLRDLQTYFLNYSIGQVDPFDGDEGRGYAEQTTFRTLHNFSAQLLTSMVFPEAGLTNNPWYANIARRFAHWEPLYYRDLQGQQGDFHLTDIQWFNYKYLDLALMLQDGAILRQHARSFQVRPAAPDFFPLFGEAFVPYYFPTAPAEKNWDEPSYLDVTAGWCMSSTYPPNDWNAFTNGVGFVFTARPGGNRNEHGSWHDGSIQLWAYGTQVSCGGIGAYYKHPMLYPGLFVDGIGAVTPNGTYPTEDWYSRFIAFTNTTDYTYIAAELGRAFNRSNFPAGGGNGNLTFNYNLSTNRRPYVASVQRHVLFPHKKYLVLYDTFETTTNATFQWKWNIMEPTATVNTGACSFTYTTTNFYNGSNVTVYVQHMVDPNTMSLMNLVGTNYAVINPFTGEDFTSSTNPEGPRWNSTIWVSNKTKAKNWHFLSVVYPVKWGDPPPTITRLDDYTVRVQHGADDDTISFDGATTQAVTMVVDLTRSGPLPPTNLRIVP